MPSGTVVEGNYTTVHPTGKSCARVSVKQATDPPWHAKLRLGYIRAVNQMLTVAFSAKSGEGERLERENPPHLTVDVVDGSEWIGHWRKFNVTSTEWRRFEANISLPLKMRNHIMDVSLVLGYRPTTYYIDDVSITQTTAPPPPPAPPPVAWGATYDFERPKGPSGVVELQTATTEAADGAYADLHSPLAGRAEGTARW